MVDQPDRPPRCAAVIIGRNEGERLVACLASLAGRANPLVYVDSGSTDGSVETAERAGARVVRLDLSTAFTAARARNVGLEVAIAQANPEFVQFVDGDCEVRDGWLDTARRFLDGSPRTAVVCGRRRERHPDASIWNRLIDREWDTPVGEAAACGGDAMIRVAALAEVGGFDPALIAGEEPEMCLRLRRAGWTIHRLDAEMTLHDAAMTRFSQWWRRNVRAGHVAAEGLAMHGSGPERYNVDRVSRALLWGAGVPLLAIAGSALSSWALAILVAWPAQVARLVLRGEPLERAVFLTLGKLPEAQGVLGYRFDRLRGHRRGLIEYK